MKKSEMRLLVVLSQVKGQRSKKHRKSDFRQKAFQEVFRCGKHGFSGEIGPTGGGGRGGSMTHRGQKNIRLQ